MKIGRFLALGTLAYGAYYAYKRREDIKEEILDLNQSREKYLSRSGQISNATSTSSRNKTLFSLTSNKTLTIKHASSRKNLEPRLNIIQERLKKYQGEDKE